MTLEYAILIKMVLAKDMSCFEGEHEFEIQILGSLTSDHQT